MLVGHSNFDDVVDLLCSQPMCAVDCETTGLAPYGTDTLFSVIFATSVSEFYFNFNLGTPGALARESITALQQIFNAPSRVVAMQNAKFDMAFLAKEGIEVKSIVHDTKSTARLINSNLPSYSLDALAKLCLGKAKDDAVKAYIMEHKLWHWQKVPGKLMRQKHLRFDKVPLDVIVPYAELDARLTYDLAEWQLKTMHELHKNAEAAQHPPFKRLYLHDQKLTKTVFHMEQRGVKIDVDYCMKAIIYENEREQELKYKFYCEVGEEYVDSNKFLQKVIPKEYHVMGKPSEKTRQVQPTFAYEAIAHLYGENPAISRLIDIRDARSRANYYEGFLHHADRDNILHANFDQAGTATGRFSSNNPNLQNLTKEDATDAAASEYLIRRAIVPREDYCFLMVDYNAMEYRLMLDLAGAMGLIEKVKGGLDVHQATADMAGITRKQAKTVNFGVLYGIGLEKLGRSLGVSKVEAERIRDAVFSAAPEVKHFIRTTIKDAENSAWTVNWFGRRCNFEDRNVCYRAPNYKIQGGCADIVKIAMNGIADLLHDKRSKLVLTIHDENLCEIHKDELHLMPEIIKIMERAYPFKHLPMKCEASISWKSLADKEPYLG